MGLRKALEIDSDPDAALVDAINSGETDLFPKLIKRYEQKLFNLGFRMCNDIQDAEDLVQETFLNVFKSLHLFRFESRFKNWIYKIASRVCLKKRRRPKSAPEKELSFETLAEHFQQQAPEAMPGWAQQPIDSLLTAEMEAVLKNTIAALPAKYRIVIILRDLEGMSTDETAEVLGISVANVKVRLHRARLYLREQLHGYMAHVA